jgi:uncharacterized membrane protein YvbJ
MKEEQVTFICPNCGHEVLRNAKACPHCGSDENTGWSEQTYLDGIDLPNEESVSEFLSTENVKKKDIIHSKTFYIFCTFLLIFVLLHWIIRC